jgi:hypothetical protein
MEIQSFVPVLTILSPIFLSFIFLSFPFFVYFVYFVVSFQLRFHCIHNRLPK